VQKIVPTIEDLAPANRAFEDAAEELRQALERELYAHFEVQRRRGELRLARQKLRRVERELNRTRGKNHEDL
jgi:hypothetical protein